MMEWRTTRADATCDTLRSCPITGIASPLESTNDRKLCKLTLPGPLFVRVALWLAICCLFPLSVTAARLSFNFEVLGRTPYPLRKCGEASAPRVDLAERVLLHLEAAEKKESDAWLRDDIRIAWITVLEASRGNPQPHIDATYRVLGLHPDKVWPAICARRAALLGREFGLIGADAPPTCQRASNQVAELSPKKPCASERNPRWRKVA